MDLTSGPFVQDLQEALRCGMVAALDQDQNLKSIGASGVERTLYAKLREKAVEHLDSLGYDYLTSDDRFFVIGEVGVPGTNKRADGMICDPESCSPVFAIEVGMDGSKKFYSDFRKAIKEWTRTGLRGVFILLFDNKQDDVNIYNLDGAVMRTPRKEGFFIFPLIASTEPSFERALASTTCSRFWGRHHPGLRILTISNRHRGEVNRWTTDLIQPVAEASKMLCVNEIRQTGEDSLDQVFDSLKPQIFILEGEKSPLAALGPLGQQQFKQYRKRELPLVVFIGGWVDRKSWEDDPVTENLLPVRIIGEDHESGGWDCWKLAPKFGKEIRPGNRPFLNLEGLNNTTCSIGGFIKATPKERLDVRVDLEVTTPEGTFPLIVTDKAERVVWLGTGTGGWGAEWYKKYPEEYQKVWQEVLTKFGIVNSSGQK